VVARPQGKGFSFAQAPAYGYSIAEPSTGTDAPVAIQENAQGFTLENGLVRARFNAQGRLTSFFDKRQARETIEPGGKGNQFVLFEDKPVKWDAWDVDIYHLEKSRAVGRVLQRRIVAKGPLRAIVELDYEISPRCQLVQRISLDAESPRLDFACQVDWQEKEQFLKVEFPLALRSDYATYEIQFGHVRRPTHFNTSWDFARFEVSAHRWADLSEPAYGVALLNDSKYGYACHGNVLRLSLLRAPKSPDAQADMGKHHFRYALFPHRYGPQLGGVIAEAAAFNQPLQVSAVAAEPQQVSFFQIDNSAVVIDTVKKAEDSSDLIIRLYESHGAHQRAVLQTALPAKRVSRVDLLEGNAKSIPNLSSKIKLALRPFELVTLKVTLQK
jgi:alpha-mannosidase